MIPGIEAKFRSMCKFYTVSPLHAGSGAATGAVDLPIQRERHTSWPIIQASEVKGAFRWHFRGVYAKETDEAIKLEDIIFGSDEFDDKKDAKRKSRAGTLVVTDAKLFAFPMRSNVAPFVWVTCPSVLKKFKQDMKLMGKTDAIKIPKIPLEDHALWVTGKFGSNQEVLLEDAVVRIAGQEELASVTKIFPELNRLLVVSDAMFDYCVTTATEVRTGIKIDPKTGVTVDGSLRYQEFLPADSVMYTLVFFKGAEDIEKGAETIAASVRNTITDFIQIGGSETMGHGIMRVEWEKYDKGGKQ